MDEKTQRGLIKKLNIALTTVLTIGGISIYLIHNQAYNHYDQIRKKRRCRICMY